MSRRGVYVEIHIAASVDEVWRFTQDPGIHQRWDLRFSEIRYLPKASDSAPQRFLYATRIGFGKRIEGQGESTGTREAHGMRVSALEFWSADPLSLIEEGSGYWQYHPEGSGTRFLTWYDYRVRFGVMGRVIDAILFRPMIGWATAWSFDRLRMWIETGLPPETARRSAIINTVARLAIVFTWLYHGLVPKLLASSLDERRMLTAAGLPESGAIGIGVIEILFAAAGLFFWPWRGFFVLTVLAMVVALAGVAWSSPEYLVAAFNPVTLNLGMVALSIVGFLASLDAPFAGRCRRQPKDKS